MYISSASLDNGLAQLASQMRSSQTQSSINSAVTKQILDAEKIQMEMITKLIQSMPSPDQAVGRSVDISA